MPWARPRHELLLLALVAVAALTPAYGINAQDTSRLCLTRALQHGNLSNDECLAGKIDKAYYGGHLYSDKAPGMSVIELPIANAVRLSPIERITHPDRRLWTVRVLSSGLAFLLCVFLVGRVAEGIAAGAGGAAAVSFGLGTLVSSLASANFGHITAAALGFGAFLLAWSGRPLLAGFAAGAAPLVEYQTGAIVLILLLYLAARGLRPAVAFAAGAVPGIALLLAYDQFAFGAPWHLSYRYVANGYALEQSHGFFGVGAPKLFSTYEVFSGRQGLLVVSPVLAAGVWGLALLARRLRREVLVCTAVLLFFVLLDCSYFLPYGGVSPGPRFLIPALPFLALGLAPAFAARPRLVTLLAAVSVVGSTATILVWSANQPLHRTIWGELAHPARFGDRAADNALQWIGLGRTGATLAVFAAALAALAAGVAPLARRRAAPRPVAALAGAIGIAAVAAASAIAEYPYHGRVEAVAAPVTTSISTTPLASTVELTFSLTNPTPEPATDVWLIVRLPGGVEPQSLRPGCTGRTNVWCRVGVLRAGTTAPVRLDLRVLGSGERTVEAWARVNGTAGRPASATVRTATS